MRALEVRLAWEAADGLSVRFELDADVSRLRLEGPLPQDELWRHTCFELFIAGSPGASRAAYHELNFSPSGAWSAYAFTRYRDGARIEERSLDPVPRVSAGERMLTLDALIRLERLGIARDPGGLPLALSAVIESREGALSYWALRHPPGKPDFHHPEAFAFLLG